MAGTNRLGGGDGGTDRKVAFGWTGLSELELSQHLATTGGSSADDSLTVAVPSLEYVARCSKRASASLPRRAQSSWHHGAELLGRRGPSHEGAWARSSRSSWPGGDAGDSGGGRHSGGSASTWQSHLRLQHLQYVHSSCPNSSPHSLQTSPSSSTSWLQLKRQVHTHWPWRRASSTHSCLACSASASSCSSDEIEVLGPLRSVRSPTGSEAGGGLGGGLGGGEKLPC